MAQKRVTPRDRAVGREWEVASETACRHRALINLEFLPKRRSKLAGARNLVPSLVADKKRPLPRVWPPMLRHSCGYYLADQGTDLRTMQEYLGHRDPKHTAHYTPVAGHRFEGLWKSSD